MRLPRVRFTLRRTSSPGGATGTETPDDVGRGRNRSVGVKRLMVLVAACGAIFWAARVMRDMVAPVYQWARQVRDGDVDERREAAGELGTLKGSGIRIALPALGAAIGDEDQRVAIIATESLGEAIQAA